MNKQGRVIASMLPVRPTSGRDRSLFLDGMRADLTALTSIRHRLAQFAGEIGLPADTTGDVLLATYEALANAAEHAYPSEADGTVDLRVVDHVDDGVLSVSVVDRGSWKPEVDNSRARRGRGVRLMRACSDDVRIETDDEGTRIYMQWKYGTDHASLPDVQQQEES